MITACKNCPYFKDGICTDEENWVDENGNSQCRYNPTSHLESKKENSDFTPFTKRLPKQGRWILVTNWSGFNQMSQGEDTAYLWLAKRWDKDQWGEFMAFTDEGVMLFYITHWRYAIEEKSR